MISFPFDVDNVLYSNYNETVQIQDARGKSGQVYDNHEYDSSIKGSEVCIQYTQYLTKLITID